MRIAALMSFYDEPVELLADVVASLEGFCDELVALDGAYALFHDGRASSGAAQHATLLASAEAAGLGCTLRVPADVWEGNEVEKRDALFRLGDAVAADWYFIVDGDYVLEQRDHSAARAALADTRRDVANVTITEPNVNGDGIPSSSPLPLLYRATPGIRVGPTHYHYRAAGEPVTRKGLPLWLFGDAFDVLTPRLDLTARVSVRHETHRRSDYRRSQQWTYYFARNANRIEHATPQVMAEQARRERIAARQKREEVVQDGGAVLHDH